MDHSATFRRLAPELNWAATVLVGILANAGEVKAQQPAWTGTGSIEARRFVHSVTLLADGKALVTGGRFGCTAPGAACTALNNPEIHDPATRVWSPIAGMGNRRYNHAAVPLPNGKVLVAGGSGELALNSAEIFDPETGSWSATGSLAGARAGATATLLENGKVLVAGGTPALASAELYDPATGAWSSAGMMNSGRAFHTATLLADGRVLVAGGLPVIASAEIFDPAAGTWTRTGSLHTARVFARAALLTNGRVMVAGGSDNRGTIYGTVELFDPATGEWSSTGSMTATRISHTLTLLPDGKVLAVAGNSDAGAHSSAEVYDPASGTWSATAGLAEARTNHGAALLANGNLLVVGGNGNSSPGLRSAELYDVGVPTLATISSASFMLGALAPKSLASTFGENLTTEIQTASGQPWPTTLGGVAVRIKDVGGTEQLAPLLSVAPKQVNFQVPGGTKPGPAEVRVTGSDGRSHSGVIQVIPAAPALFTLNQNGKGPAAAINAVSSAPAPFAAVGPAGEPGIVAFFGSGLGPDATDLDSNVAASVHATISGSSAHVIYAGRAPGFIGLNQINVVLPTGIASGIHTVVMSRDGMPSNAVTIEIR